MSVLRGKSAAGALVLQMAVALTAAVSASDASACGYDEPQNISRGSLNWIYPDSLHVIGAISREVAARRLPLANFDHAGPDLFGRRYRATSAALQQFAGLLRAASADPLQTPVSMVLVEPVLWTRFEPGTDGLYARVHVSGAAASDLVLVSGEAVVAEIVNGRLTIGEAERAGLIRLYGSAEQKADFLDVYRLVGRTGPTRVPGAGSSGHEPQQTAGVHDARPTPDTFHSRPEAGAPRGATAQFKNANKPRRKR
jgi:hypothetical protein